MNKSRMLLILGGLAVVALIGVFLFTRGGTPEPITVKGGKADTRNDGNGSTAPAPVDPSEVGREEAGDISVQVPDGYDNSKVGSGANTQIVITRPGNDTPSAVVAQSPAPAPTTDEYIALLTAPIQNGTSRNSEPAPIAGVTGRLIRYDIGTLGSVRFVVVAVVDGKAISVTTEGPASAQVGLRKLALDLARTVRVEG